MKSKTVKKLKETQGSIKFKQYVEDLLRNRHFMATAKKLMVAYSESNPKNSAYEEVMGLLKEYRKLDAKAKKYLKNNYSELDKFASLMAEKYGLDMELLRPVIFSLSSLKEGKFKQSILYDAISTDLCFFVDNNDDNLNPSFPPMPFALDTRKQDHFKVFPVSIDIHRFATKRDLLDFIEKKWFWIENCLAQYREYKNVKFRRRKLDRKITDFIWKNKDLPTKELKILFDKKFPNNSLVYYEFSKIISQENKRRNRKIIVGQ